MSDQQLTLNQAPEIDSDLVHGAIQFLNRTLYRSGVKVAVEVSEYVIATFLGGDSSLLASKDPFKTGSLRALAEHPDLQMGAATLNRLVRIGLQVRHLPADLAEELSPSHHRALLTVKNAAHKQHLAREAVQNHWTAQQLEATIAAEKPQDEPHQGRPPQSPVVKWVNALQKTAGQEQFGETMAEAFHKLPKVHQAKVKAELKAVHAEIGAVLKLMKE